MRAVLGSLAIFVAFSSVSPLVLAARADEEPLRLMHETTSYTDVIDAFDQGDPFDLNAQVQYTRTSDTGTIQREYTNDAGERRRTRIAESERVMSSLSLEIDIGLYRDLMAFVRLPLILSDARSLSLPSGKSEADVAERLRDPYDARVPSRPLFGVPFDSPTRAGFDYVAIGAGWAILNQQRKPWLPNWVFFVEGRRAIGSPVRPCRIDSDGATVCGTATETDIDGDGANDGTNAALAGDKPGSSRGVSGISIETRLSRRYRYAEPYGGIGLLVEWPSTAKKFFDPAGKLDGVLNRLPAQQVAATLGAAVIPWENRARHQRFAFDARLSATYYTQGHDYGALYDALGTSNHAELARPNFEGVRGVLDPNAGRLTRCTGPDDTNCYEGAEVPFYGLTDIQSHLKYGFRVGIELSAAEYVRFAFGSGFTWVTAHALTMADACNPGARDGSRAESYRGATCGGIVNPNHRPNIDLPGRRFWMTSEFIIDLYATATAQF